MLTADKNMCRYLPPELVAIILASLSVQDLLACRLVCQSWCSVASGVRLLWHRALLRECKRYPPHASYVNPDFLHRQISAPDDAFALCRRLARRQRSWQDSKWAHQMPFCALSGPGEKTLAVKVLLTTRMRPVKTARRASNGTVPVLQDSTHADTSSPQRVLVAGGGYDKVLFVWSWDPAGTRWIVAAEYFTGVVISCLDMVECDNGDVRIACGSYANMVLLYSLQHGLIRRIPMQGITPMTIALSTQHIAVGSTDGYAVQIACETGAVHTHNIRQQTITALRMVDALLASMDGALLVYDLSRTPPAFVGNFGTGESILSMEVVVTPEHSSSSKTGSTSMSCYIVASTSTGLWSLQMFQNADGTYHPAPRPPVRMYVHTERPLSTLPLLRNITELINTGGSARTVPVDLFRTSSRLTPLISRVACTSTHIVGVCGYLIHVWNLRTLSYVATIPYDAYMLHARQDALLSQTLPGPPDFQFYRANSVNDAAVPPVIRRWTGVYESDVVNDSAGFNSWKINDISCVEDCVVVGCGDGGVRVWSFWPPG
ncbi:hypothetical protein RI367_001907 [Sorochytrium milnesiophthora]